MYFKELIINFLYKKELFKVKKQTFKDSILKATVSRCDQNMVFVGP